MKKTLITIMITSLVMIGLIGTFIWKMNDISTEIAADEDKLLQQEKDIDEEEKAVTTLDRGAVIPLYLSGDLKNVVTTGEKTRSEIYNPKHSAMAEEMLTEVKKKGEFTQDDPLWAYNPYGTNPNSLYLYFVSKGKYYCRYSISVNKENIPDFTRTLNNGSSGNVTKEHEYQIMGLIPGETNYIVLKLYNSKDELSKTFLYKIDMPDSTSGAQVVLNTEKGSSKSQMSNGLFTVFQKGVPAILLYDNSGVLRGEIPVKDYSGQNMEIIYDNLVFAWSKSQLAMMNSLGQITDSFRITGYEQTGEFAYDGSGSIYILAKKNRSDTGSSKVLKLDLGTGEYDLALDMDTLLPGVLKEAGSKKKARRNWITLNSIQATNVNQILVSSESLSSVFKVSNVNTMMPKVEYIIADKSLWKKHKKLRRKVLDKVKSEEESAESEQTLSMESILDGGKEDTRDVFVSQFGQSALIYKAATGESEEQYYLSMLNNNTGKGASKSSNKSYYYTYLVDEAAGTYLLEKRQAVEKNAAGGNIQTIGKNYVYCQSAGKVFREMDQQGQTIQSYRTRKAICRTFKNDWKGFWFY